MAPSVAIWRKCDRGPPARRAPRGVNRASARAAGSPSGGDCTATSSLLRVGLSRRDHSQLVAVTGERADPGWRRRVEVEPPALADRAASQLHRRGSPDVRPRHQPGRSSAARVPRPLGHDASTRVHRPPALPSIGFLLCCRSCPRVEGRIVLAPCGDRRLPGPQGPALDAAASLPALPQRTAIWLSRLRSSPAMAKAGIARVGPTQEKRTSTASGTRSPNVRSRAAPRSPGSHGTSATPRMKVTTDIYGHWERAERKL